jgi:hypothetical protein
MQDVTRALGNVRVYVVCNRDSKGQKCKPPKCTAPNCRADDRVEYASELPRPLTHGW